jgi:hypothetical protein
LILQNCRIAERKETRHERKEGKKGNKARKDEVGKDKG